MLLHLLISLFLSPPHGDLDLRIASLSQLIQSHPDSTELYLHRGELYVLHEEYTLALADFDRCTDDGMDNARLHAGLGQCLVAVAHADDALAHFDLALQQDPDLFSIKEAKARLLLLMQQPCSSALLYEEILKEASTPGPSVFIDASLMWLQCTDVDGKQKSIALLEEGITRLGPLHVLQKELVKRYVEMNDLKTAIAWQSKIIDRSASPSPLLDRAELHFKLNDFTAALNDIQSAIANLNAMPAHRKSTAGIQQLLARATELQKQISR
jgi:tetratricopeptide (TPR) repeat protein